MNLILLTCLGLMSVLSVQASDNFHCLRNQQACAAGTCNTATGICDCTTAANEQGEDCATPAATTTVCTVDNCDLLGKVACYVDGGADTCYCKTDYYGATCADERLTNTCSTTTGITPIVVPYVQSGATFNGKIYAKGHIDDEANCHLAGDPYTKTIAIGACGETTTPSHTETSLDGDPVGTLEKIAMIVQYHPDFISTLDLEVTFSCFTPDGDVISALPVEVAQVTGDTGFKEATKLVSMTGLSLAVTDDGGTALPTTGVAFGTVIKMVVTLDTSQGFDDLHVDSLGHDPEAAPVDDANTKYVIENGCGQVGYKAVLVDFTKGTLTVTIQFNAFRSTSAANDQAMNFFLKVQLCKTTCTPPTCTTAPNYEDTANSINAAGKRKRRQADEDQLEDLRTSIIVLSPGQTTALGNQGSAGPEGCLERLVFLLPLVVLVVLCLMSMAMAMYFCVKLSNKKKYDSESHGGLSGPYKG